jgi:hypothetical protein
VVFSRHDHHFSKITKLKKRKEKRKKKIDKTLVESGKWRNLEQLGQNKTNVSPKKAKEGWEGGQLSGQEGQ